MNAIQRTMSIRRSCIIIHVAGFLLGRTPLYLNEVTTCTNTNGTKSLRREYVEVSRLEAASHVSYLGKRDVHTEVTNEDGSVFYGNAMELNEPISVELFKRINEEYGNNPDASPEMLAYAVTNTSYFKLTGERKWTKLKPLQRFSNWISKTFHWMQMAL